MTASMTREEPQEDLRKYIDRIDRTILALLTERRRLRAVEGPWSVSSTARIFDVINKETGVVTHDR